MGQADRDWYREDRKRRDQLKWTDGSGRRRGRVHAYLVECLRLFGFIGAAALMWWMLKRLGGG